MHHLVLFQSFDTVFLNQLRRNSHIRRRGLPTASVVRRGLRYDQSGLEALAFSAEGDMRNALNGAQPGAQPAKARIALQCPVILLTPAPSSGQRRGRARGRPSTPSEKSTKRRSSGQAAAWLRLAAAWRVRSCETRAVDRMNDQPQPEKVKSCLEASLKKDAKARRPDRAASAPKHASAAAQTAQGTFGPMHEIWNQGYSTTDIISTFSLWPWQSLECTSDFARCCRRVAKQMEAPEHIKLEWLKEDEIRSRPSKYAVRKCRLCRQIGLAHARVTAGAQNLLQLDAMAGYLARLFGAAVEPGQLDLSEVSKIILASERGTELGFRD